MQTLDQCMKEGDWEWWSWFTSGRRERIIEEFQEYSKTTHQRTIQGFNTHLWNKWVLPLMTQRAKKCVKTQWVKRTSSMDPKAASPISSQRGQAQDRATGPRSQRRTAPSQQAVQKIVPLGSILRKPEPSFKYRVGDFVVILDKSICDKKQSKSMRLSLFIEVIKKIVNAEFTMKNRGEQKHPFTIIQYVILSPDDDRLHNHTTTKVQFVTKGDFMNPTVQVQFKDNQYFKSSTNIYFSTQKTQSSRSQPFNEIVPGSMLSLNLGIKFVVGDYVFGLKSTGDYVLGRVSSLDWLKSIGSLNDLTEKSYFGEFVKISGKEHCNFVRIFPPSAQSQAIRCASQFLKP